MPSFEWWDAFIILAVVVVILLVLLKMRKPKGCQHKNFSPGRGDTECPDCHAPMGAAAKVN